MPIISNHLFTVQVVSSEILDKLRDQWEVLGEFVGHRIDEVLVKHLKKHH